MVRHTLNIAANTANFLECVRQVWDIMHFKIKLAAKMKISVNERIILSFSNLPTCEKKKPFRDFKVT